MTASSQFYLAQAANCTKSAQNAILANQRDMYLRAGAAWQALADREQDVTAAREQRDADKIARQQGAESPAIDAATVFGAALGGETR